MALLKHEVGQLKDDLQTTRRERDEAASALGELKASSEARIALLEAQKRAAEEKLIDLETALDLR